MSEPNDEKWLRDGLASAVPDAPTVPDRADGARSKARRARRTTMAVLGGAAASVLLVAGVVAVLGDDEPDGGDVANDGPASPYDVAACPDAPVDTRSQAGPDHVPDGAASVRLCGGNEFPVDVPADALVTDVDALAAAVNGLEAAAPDLACTMELGPAYQLVFGYPDGSTVVASGELYGCRPVVVNGVERTGADVPWEKFIELLRAQREQLDPPAVPEVSTIDCGTTGVPSVGQPSELAVAVLCVEAAGGSGEWQRVEIPDTDLAVLRTDIADPSHEAKGVPRCVAPPPAVRLVGATGWGDPVDLQPQCHLSYFRASGLDSRSWNPTDETRAILERLVGEAR